MKDEMSLRGLSLPNCSIRISPHGKPPVPTPFEQVEAITRKPALCVTAKSSARLPKPVIQRHAEVSARCLFLPIADIGCGAFMARAKPTLPMRLHSLRDYGVRLDIPSSWLNDAGGRFAMQRSRICDGKAHSGALRRRWSGKSRPGVTSTRSGRYD